jgi:invasion protein IalB
MTGSIDGRIAPRRARIVLLAAFVFGFGTGLAMAQEVPKKAPPSASKIGAAPSVSAWVKICSETDQTKRVCLLKYEGLDPKSGDVLVAAALRTTEGNDKQELIVTVPTAYSLLMPPGVRIKIDGDEPISLPYVGCTSTSCQAEVEVPNQVLDRMRKGNQMLIAAISTQQEPLTFRVLLKGFATTSDGAPVDEAKYKETRARAMELAKQPYQQTNQSANGQEGSPQPVQPITTIPKISRPAAPQ